MFKYKKDWLYDYKGLATLSFIFMAVFLGIYIITMNVESKTYWEVSLQILKSTTKFGTGMFMSLLIIAVGSVCPLSSEHFGPKVQTNILPLSNKQIVLRGIKLWLKVLSLWIMESTFINILFESKVTSQAVSEMLLVNIVEIFVVIIILLIVIMQITGSMITAFSKNIRWYTILVVQLLANSLLFYISMFIINRTMDTAKDITWLFVLVGIIFISSLIYFLYSFRNIERVYR